MEQKKNSIWSNPWAFNDDHKTNMKVCFQISILCFAIGPLFLLVGKLAEDDKICAGMAMVWGIALMYFIIGIICAIKMKRKNKNMKQTVPEQQVAPKQEDVPIQPKTIKEEIKSNFISAIFLFACSLFILLIGKGEDAEWLLAGLAIVIGVFALYYLIAGIILVIKRYNAKNEK